MERQDSKTLHLLILQLASHTIAKPITRIVNLFRCPKGFDDVNHSMLLDKLYIHIWIRRPALSWIISYLSNKYQYVVHNGYESECRYTNCGVPKEFILSSSEVKSRSFIDINSSIFTTTMKWLKPNWVYVSQQNTWHIYQTKKTSFWQNRLAGCKTKQFHIIDSYANTNKWSRNKRVSTDWIPT